MSRPPVRIAAIALAVAACDQASKALVRRYFVLGQVRPLLPFFSLTHIENTGTAFGVLAEKNSFLAITSLLVLLGLAAAHKHLAPERRTGWLGQGLVWGGALGNMADRLFRGRVTDFLDVFAGPYHWPSFNVADSAITVGAALLLWTTTHVADPR